MDVTVFVNEGFLGFKCEGVLPLPPSKIQFDRQSRVFTISFARTDRQVTLDCPVDDETLAAIEDQKVCGFGCYEGDKKLAALMVPLEQINW